MSSPSPAPPEDGRLDSWKQIAAYLDKSERTVRRWQLTEGLPVHKHLHQQRGSVWAYQRELDEWLAGRREPLVEAPPARIPWMAIAAIMAVVAIAAGGWLFSHRPPPPLPSPVPFTAFPGAEYGGSFSPDGQQAAFFWTGNGSDPGIYVKSINSDQATPLVVTGDFNYSPAWSPDGKTVAFLRRTSEPATWLCLIASAGGPDRKLILLSPRAGYFANHRHVSWSNDSQWLLAPVANPPWPEGIYRISLDGEARPVTKPGGASFAPALAPDGRRFAFIRGGGSTTGTFEILLQKVTGDGTPEGGPESIYKGQGRSSGIDWAPGGKELVLCTEGIAPADRLETRLYRLPAQPGARLTRIGPGGCTTVAVSRPDASGRSALLFGSERPSRVALRQARLDDLDQASEFVPSSRSDSFPSFSPDGNSLAFVSNRSGQHEVWLVGRDGGTSRRLTENGQARSRPDWSPDGSRLLYGSASSEPPGLAIVPIAGGSALPVPLGGELAQDPVWSHDGRRIYYSSGAKLMRSGVEGSDRVMLQQGTRYIPVGESPDGRSLYFVKLTKGIVLSRMPAGGGPDEIVEDGLASRYVARTNRALYFVHNDSGLYQLPFGEKQARKLKAFLGSDPKRYAVLQGMTVSPDDTRIVWAVVGEPQVDLELIRDFR